MPYKTNGETHHSGIGNEKELIELMNSTPDMNINKYLQNMSNSVDMVPKWGHLGGTTQKADCDVIIEDKRYLISIKNHEKTGTFDWINTSKLEEFNEELGKSLKTEINKFKTENKDNDVTPTMRNQIACIFSNEFDCITSEQIKTLLSALYVKYPEYVIINHRHDNNIIMYPKENNFQEFVGYSDWEYFLKTTARAKTSRMIFRRKLGEEVNTNLRLRLVLNNGVGALVGKSEKNKCSIPCLKIQQDKVGILLSKLVNTIIDSSNITETHHHSDQI
jgi:DNA-directed RNA polymerase subunit F